MVISLNAAAARREVEALLASAGAQASLREPLKAIAERLAVRL
jgi:hypothetical protein